MDIEELLDFQPARTLKRGPDADADGEFEGMFKRKAMEAPQKKNYEDMTDEERLALVMELDEDKAVEMDEGTVKRMVMQLEKKYAKNQELRIKHAEQPEKFMESEIELHVEVGKCLTIATQPQLYPVLVQSNGVKLIVSLLAHSNSDIVLGVVDLLHELTDTDVINEALDEALVLVEALVKNQIMSVLVQVLEAMDEKNEDEAKGLHNILGIAENLVEADPELADHAFKQGLLAWILNRLKIRSFDQNKLYCSELLAILLQSSVSNRTQLGNIEGIDTMLQALALYKRRNPQIAEEQEMMHNLFDSLCLSLLAAENRDIFLKGEGVELMILMLREKKMSRPPALKVLNFALQGDEGINCCAKFIDVYGLRSLFPCFMKTPGKKAKRGGFSEQEWVEHVTSIISHLLRNLSGSQLQRLMNKFVEDDHLKVDRLIELHLFYLNRAKAVDREIMQEKSQLDEIDEEKENEFYMKRLDAGLFTLQRLNYIILSIGTAGIASVLDRVKQLLSLKGENLQPVREIMQEYAESLGDDKNKANEEKMNINHMINQLT